MLLAGGQNLKITVIGTGYVGLVVGACLSDMGHDIICLDVDKDKIDQLNNGKIPIYEPGLNDIIERNVADNRISFTTDKEKAIKNLVFSYFAPLLGFDTKN